ncbi:MAG: DNA-binding protein [Myxococcales bacterium]|nr:DNA-binding protein [Myxococcales bacterium]|tara:strand:- start:27 stop:338 length:312 start_codon:yes stop_codon:yes gene_type:complete
MGMSEARFKVGQVVIHRRFGYRGVIVRVDNSFNGSEEWYDLMASSRPPKNRPWYHVLVHQSGHKTYVTERNLALDESKKKVCHPLIEHYFVGFRNGVYFRLVG